MSEGEVIYLADEEILVTGTWAIFGERRYAIPAILTVWLEEHYTQIGVGAALAAFGILLMIVLPPIGKAIGFIFFAFGVERMRRREHAVCASLALSDEGTPVRAEHIVITELFNSPDRNRALNITDAIKVAKIFAAHDRARHPAGPPE